MRNPMLTQLTLDSNASQGMSCTDSFLHVAATICSRIQYTLHARAQYGVQHSGHMEQLPGSRGLHGFWKPQEVHRLLLKSGS